MLPRTPKGNRLFGGRPVTAAIRTSPRFKRITALATGVVFGVVSLFHPLTEGKGFVFARTAREEERERERERDPREGEREREREPRHTEVEPGCLRSPFGESFKLKKLAGALRARRLLDAARRSALFNRKTVGGTTPRHKSRQYEQ